MQMLPNIYFSLYMYATIRLHLYIAIPEDSHPWSVCIDIDIPEESHPWSGKGSTHAGLSRSHVRLCDSSLQ